MSSRWISISFREVPAFGHDGGVSGLDERRLAHAARAPQQHVVGREAVGEAARIVEKDVANPVDAADKTDLDAVDDRYRGERRGRRIPDETLA